MESWLNEHGNEQDLSYWSCSGAFCCPSRRCFLFGKDVGFSLFSWLHGWPIQGVNGQSNMWGEIAGTGLAGGGTGAAGKHGDTSQGATAASEAGR